MAKENVGKFKYASKGKTGLIYVPSDVVRDSTFPFVEDENILIRINNSSLIVEKTKKGAHEK